MKGIILAGGNGTRLDPLTRAVSKHLLPVYDKPMVYYPLATLMLAGIQEYLLISTPHDLPAYQRLLGDGSQFGIHIHYAEQSQPRGIAEALIIAERWLAGHPVALILGDNIFHGQGLRQLLNEIRERHMTQEGATIFAYEVAEPSRYGVVVLNEHGTPETIVEKPQTPISNLAVPGLYFFDQRAAGFAQKLVPSARGELEITDVNRRYLKERCLNVVPLGRGIAWFDAGTTDALLDVTHYMAAVEKRQQRKVACPEEVAWRQGWINRTQLKALAKCARGAYQDYLERLVEEP